MKKSALPFDFFAFCFDFYGKTLYNVCVLFCLFFSDVIFGLKSGLKTLKIVGFTSRSIYDRRYSILEEDVGKFIIEHSAPLRGEVEISGAKNAVLPIMAATSSVQFILPLVIVVKCPRLAPR